MIEKALFGILPVAGFIFFVSFTSLYVQIHLTEYGFCPIPIPILLPAFASLGVFVGSLVYYLMSSKLEESKEKSSGMLNTLLEMLQQNEKEIIKKIIENKGEILQSKLSSEFGKLKTFRTVETLKKRGIILKEKYGKTNKIKLSEKFKQTLV